MPKLDAENISMLSKNSNDPRFEQLETGVFHTPYKAETAFFTCIENGDIGGVENMMQAFIENSIVVGRMSKNDLRQMQYFAVCCVALATRHAIRGGLSEFAAFNLSDSYIQTIDSFTDISQIPPFLSEKAIELATLVRGSAFKKDYPDALRAAIYYIESHLYEDISAVQVAKSCALSNDYLNILFKNHTGKTLNNYISHAKLEESRRLIRRGLTNSQITYQLGFCSESYFIAKYKAFFGCTPGEERKNR